MKILLNSILIVLLSISTTFAYGDLNLKGYLKDQNTKEPLMFANMAVKGYAVGTATDVNGYFNLSIGDNYFKDTLVISMIGYKTLEMPIKTLLDQKDEVVFFLAPAKFEFPTVEIGAPIILNDIFFEHNKHELLPESYPELKKLFDYLEKHPEYKIEISGHTDNTGEDDYNQALSNIRAGSVVAWLEEEGIDQRRMVAKGYGEIMPIATNETELGKSQNRRVEFKVLSTNFNFDNDLITIGGGSQKKGVEPDDKMPEIKPDHEKEKPVDDNKKKAKTVFQPKDNPTNTLTAVEFKKMAETALEKQDFHGVVMYASDEKIEYQSVHGNANLTYDVPNKATTRFYIGTLAEQFTTVLALKMVQNGKIALTDRIGKYLPNFPNSEYKTQITIGHLLSHTSGIANENTIQMPLQHKKGKYQHNDYFKTFASKDLLHAPGTAYAHSALNLYLMAVIIEKVSNNDFENLLKTEIFDKANMTQTRSLDLAMMDKNRADNYIKNSQGVNNAVLTPASLIFGASNLVSTLTDLQRWDKALRDNTILDETHTKILTKENLKGESFMGVIENGMQTKTSTTSGTEVYYGFSKNFSVLIISNVNGSGGKQIYNALKARKAGI